MSAGRNLKYLEDNLTVMQRTKLTLSVSKDTQLAGQG